MCVLDCFTDPVYRYYNSSYEGAVQQSSVFITNSPAPSRINSAELPQRDVTVWEFAIFGYFPCIIRTVRTRSFNHKHKHRKMAIFCYFFSRFFFCSLIWEFSYSNWEKHTFWHWEHDLISVVKTGQKKPCTTTCILTKQLFKEIKCKVFILGKCT